METCLHLWEHFPKIIEGSVTPFRDARNFNQYIYGWHQHFSGNYIPTPPPRKYISVKSSINDIREAILNSENRIVCINDNEAADDIRLYAKVVRESIERRLI